MHEYTAWQVHDDRMRDLTREADASRLAAIAKQGQNWRRPPTFLRGWLSFGSRLFLEAWRSRPNVKPPAPDSGGVTALSVSSTGDR